jgi:hypothetical protein
MSCKLRAGGGLRQPAISESKLDSRCVSGRAIWRHSGWHHSPGPAIGERHYRHGKPFGLTGGTRSDLAARPLVAHRFGSTQQVVSTRWRFLETVRGCRRILHIFVQVRSPIRLRREGSGQSHRVHCECPGLCLLPLTLTETLRAIPGSIHVAIFRRLPVAPEQGFHQFSGLRCQRTLSPEMLSLLSQSTHEG